MCVPHFGGGAPAKIGSSSAAWLPSYLARSCMLSLRGFGNKGAIQTIISDFMQTYQALQGAGCIKA
jgi:hypothetical protein